MQVKTIKVRGLVLRVFDAGESDKRLLIFCKGHGRLMAYARGASKPSSRFMAAAQPFTYADFVLAQGAGFYSLTQVDMIENFYNLRTDYDRLMAAHQVTEACEKTLWDNLESDELLRLALKSLSVLAKGEVPPRQVSCIFLFRFFNAFGLRPQTDACVVCNTAVETKKMVLCEEGLVCDVHKPAASSPISRTAITMLQHILDNDLALAFRFTAPEAACIELSRAAHMLWKCHFDWELRTGF